MVLYITDRYYYAPTPRLESNMAFCGLRWDRLVPPLSFLLMHFNLGGVPSVLPHRDRALLFEGEGKILLLCHEKWGKFVLKQK